MPRWARGRALTGVGAPVVIVGAGLAGLVAAWSLERSGVATRVIEAGKTPGGRVRTYRGSFAGGALVELGGEHIDPAHEKIQQLARDLRLDLSPVVAPEGLAPTFDVAGKRVAEGELLAALEPSLAALDRDAAICQAAAEAPHAAGGRFAELDALSVAAWLRASGCRSPAREILESFASSELGLDPDRASCAPFLLHLSAARGEVPPAGRSRGRAAATLGGSAASSPLLLAALMGSCSTA